MNRKGVIEHITQWLKSYSEKARTEGFVVGISGGIDSAVTSALCSLTGMRTIAVNMPIRQQKAEFDRSAEHISWLKSRYSNVEDEQVDLTKPFESLEQTFPAGIRDSLVLANTRARLRMITLYAFATHHRLLVAGTGNKIEDFGIGFFTKYGDGGVDISPIADLMKSEVYALAEELGVAASIQKAKPTDGLFADSPSDEEQIGASYPELEWAMRYTLQGDTSPLTARQKHVLEIYKARNKANRHKIEPIPVCEIPKNLIQ